MCVVSAVIIQRFSVEVDATKQVLLLRSIEESLTVGRSPTQDDDDAQYAECISANAASHTTHASVKM